MAVELVRELLNVMRVQLPSFSRLRCCLASAAALRRITRRTDPAWLAFGWLRVAVIWSCWWTEASN
jgi:hypothetical protein